MTTAVDLFAGAGGWTTGATMAGVKVLAAVNHWPRAVETHSTNHPGAEHRCQDVAIMDPRELPVHDLLLASPACQGHSRARGTDKPHHDATRATAWAVIDVAEVCRPSMLVVENVPEFRNWPMYDLWREALRRMGYDVTENVLNAADFGVPQERVRLFLVGTREGKAPTIVPPMLPAASADAIIDWSSGGWSQVDKPGRSPNTLARIAKGRASFGSRFLSPYYGNGWCRSVERPVGTITTKDRWSVIRENEMRMLTVDEQRKAMGFPDGYRLLGTRTEQVKMLGNAVCPPLAAGIVSQIVGAGASMRLAA